MIYHVLDKNFNNITTIDTESDEGIIVENDIHFSEIINGTLLNTLEMDIVKNSGPKINDQDNNSPFETSLIKEGNYIAFSNELGQIVCVYIRAIENEDEFIRPISCVDIGTELRNGDASLFESEMPQHVEYYVNRELYDTGWEIGINELGTDIKKMVDTNSNTTPLARLQDVCQEFNCEMTFTVEFQNTKIKKTLINIFRNIGTDKTNKVLYSGVDVITMQKSVDIDNIITAIEDVNQGFNNLSTGDGRFLTKYGESIVYDREANALYGRGRTFNERFSGWITGRYESSGTSEIDNYNEAVKMLEERSKPSFSAEVDLMFNDGDFDTGDTLTFLDEDYNPPLRLKARVLKKELHRSNPENNKVVIGNYQLLESYISKDLKSKQKELNKPRSIYTVKLTTDNGVNFVEGEEKVTVITCTIFKDGVDVTNTFDTDNIFWSKVNKDGEHDEVWESKHIGVGTTVVVEAEDITEIANIKCSIATFENYYVQASYFLNGLRDVAKKVISLQDGNTITSIHISDTHYATDTITRDDIESYSRSNSHLKNVVEMTNFINCDYVVLNGDVHDGSTANKRIAIDNYNSAIDTLSMSSCPFFISWGNHCNNSWGDNRTTSISKPIKNYMPKVQTNGLHGKMKQVISNNEMYDIVTRPSTIFNIVENRSDKLGYFYYDVPGKNNRVIILNSQDIPQIIEQDGYAKYVSIEVSGYRQKQISWLEEVLRSTPEDVIVTIYQHFPFGKRYKEDMEYLPYNYEMIDGLINAFVTGGSFSKTYTANKDFEATISCNFLGRKGTVAFLAHGHTHNDKVSKDENGIVNYSIGCSVSRPKKNQGDRPLGKLEEDLWDIVVLNKKKRKVDLIRFGKGVDRSFEY